MWLGVRDWGWGVGVGVETREVGVLVCMFEGQEHRKGFGFGVEMQRGRADLRVWVLGFRPLTTGLRGWGWEVGVEARRVNADLTQATSALVLGG